MLNGMNIHLHENTTYAVRKLANREREFCVTEIFFESKNLGETFNIQIFLNSTEKCQELAYTLEQAAIELRQIEILELEDANVS